MIFLLLFYEFFKVGLFSVGGGLATIPFLQRISERYGWFSIRELSDMIAVSESTPGPIGVNMATYTGYSTGEAYGGAACGILGGITATLGILCPAVIVICLVSKALTAFRDSVLLQNAFYGIRPAVGGLIAGAMYGVYRAALFWQNENGGFSPNFAAIGVFIVLTAIYFRFQKVHPIFFILVGAVIGILFQF